MSQFPQHQSAYGQYQHQQQQQQIQQSQHVAGYPGYAPATSYSYGGTNNGAATAAQTYQQQYSTYYAQQQPSTTTGTTTDAPPPPPPGTEGNAQYLQQPYTNFYQPSATDQANAYSHYYPQAGSGVAQGSGNSQAEAASGVMATSTQASYNYNYYAAYGNQASSASNTTTSGNSSSASMYPQATNWTAYTSAATPITQQTMASSQPYSYSAAVTGTGIQPKKEAAKKLILSTIVAAPVPAGSSQVKASTAKPNIASAYPWKSDRIPIPNLPPPATMPSPDSLKATTDSSNGNNPGDTQTKSSLLQNPASSTANPANPSNSVWQWSTGETEGQAQLPTPPPRQQLNPSPRSKTPLQATASNKHTPSHVEKQSAKTEGSWPPALHQYVERAFGQCASDTQRALVESRLKQVIMEAMAESVLWTRDWSDFPLPSMAPPVPYIKVSGRGAKGRSNDDSDAESTVSSLRRSPDLSTQNDPAEIRRRQQRAQRFDSSTPTGSENSFQQKSTTGQDKHKKKQKMGSKKALPLNEDGEIDWDALTIKGTCQVLEKEYFRLTSAPDPSTIRDEHVLKRSLLLLKSKWAKKSVDYYYACSQLKAMRQDLTVQRIKNEFTVEVYESHARIALEQGDMNEFNQCQTQLRELHQSGIKGQTMEFLAYRILYTLYVQGKKKFNDGSSTMATLIAEIKDEESRHPAVGHALQVRKAMVFGNYYQYFILYETAPNMGAYIMDHMVESVRLMALNRMTRAYRPTLATKFVRTQLALSDEEAWQKFQSDYGLQLTNDRAEIDMKATRERGQLTISGHSLI